MMSSLAELEEQLRAQDDNLKEIEEILAVMPGSQDALDMQAEVLSIKRNIEQKIASLKPQDAAPPSEITPATMPPPPPPPAELTIAPSAPPKSIDDPQPIVVFKVNESVSAKYKADKQWYPATVISVMGSSSAPIYTVKYKGYNETATLKHYEVRALHPPPSAKRRAQDDNTTFPATTTDQQQQQPTTLLPALQIPTLTPTSPAQLQTQTPTILTPGSSTFSAPAAIDSTLADAARAAAAAAAAGGAAGRADGRGPVAKKVKTNKALDKAKNNWQDWRSKAASSGKVAKAAARESMFRTGESSTAKVGFTGSGHAMRKDADRTRHTYQMGGGAPEE